MAEELTAFEELAELAEAYRQADEAEKAEKKLKEQLYPAIMELITDVVKETIPLAQKKVKWDDPERREVDSWLEIHHPGWRFVESVSTDEILIEEDPELMKFEFDVEGYKFGRTVSHGAPSFDIKGFIDNEPELEDLVEETITYSLDEKKAASYLAEHPDSQTVFERYTVPGKVTPKLLPIRPIKEE